MSQKLTFLLLLATTLINASEEGSFLVEIRSKTTDELDTASSCTASVISPRHVISLKKCVGPHMLAQFEVIIGKGKYSLQQVDSMNEIAIFKTFKEMKPDEMVSVPTSETYEGLLKVYTLGENGNADKEVELVERQECETMVRTLKTDEACYGGVPCWTDDGSPVVAENNEIVAIYTGSLAKTKCKKVAKGILVDLTKYRDWMNKILDQ